MQGRFARLVAVLAALLGPMLLAGCHDKTQTPENQALTTKRQAIIQQHKDQQNQ